VLLGSTDLEQYAILLVRVSLGIFRVISGANKLSVAGWREALSVASVSISFESSTTPGDEW
jgi:hypothetical protein